MIATAGAGTHPIPHKLLTTEKLCDAIKYCLQPSVLSAVREISTAMSTEQGVQEAARSFHANLPLEDLPCDFLADRPAVWLYSSKKLSTDLKLSAAAAHVLISEERIKVKELTMYVS